MVFGSILSQRYCIFTSGSHRGRCISPHCPSNGGKRCCREFQRSRKRSTQKTTTQSLEKHWSKGFLKMFLFVRDSFWAITFTVCFAGKSHLHSVKSHPLAELPWGKVSLGLCKQLKLFPAQQWCWGTHGYTPYIAHSPCLWDELPSITRESPAPRQS